MRRLSLAAVTFTAVIAATGAQAAPSDRMKTACTNDYLKFCSQYDPDGWQTIQCMKRFGYKLSPTCRQVVQAEGIPSSGGGTKKR